MFPQRNQLATTPLTAAFGNNTGITNQQYQENPYNNTINFTETYAIPPYVGKQTLTPNFDHQLIGSLDISMQPMDNSQSQGPLYYGDLDDQTCYNLKSFMKLPAQNHWCLLTLNLILIILTVAAVIIVFQFRIEKWIIAQIVAVPFFLYFCYSCCNNPLNVYFANMKNYKEIQTVYQEMRQRTGHIQLKAECYHFTGKHRRKIVTHTANEVIPVRECIDASEELAQMKENHKYLFCKIRKYYYFGDQNSHNIFINAFSVFRNSNVSDTHQLYTHSLDITIPNFSDEIGLSIEGSGACFKPMFIIFVLLGLGYPYVRMLESMSQRYSINLIKRLTI